MNSNEQPGKFNGPAEIRIVRILPGPIERVWEYLTDPKKRARWFAGGSMEPRVGGKDVSQFSSADDQRSGKTGLESLNEGDEHDVRAGRIRRRAHGAAANHADHDEGECRDCPWERGVPAPHFPLLTR